MKHPVRIGLALVFLLLAGCSFFDGISVELRADSFEALKAEVAPRAIASMRGSKRADQAPGPRSARRFSRQANSVSS